MQYSTPASGSSGPVSRRSTVSRALLRIVLPAAALTAGLWLSPSEAAAEARCTSKPAVCSRIAAERKARQQPAPVARSVASPAAVASRSPTRCNSKPIVCARLESSGGLRAPQPPVTLARNAAAGERCTSKPVVCARLKMRPKAGPMTLAASEVR